jgi:orotate phosphoribosyltransferase
MGVAALKQSSALRPDERERSELFEIIRTSSFGRKQVVLSSGRVSNFYFDMKPTMMHPRGASIIAKLLLVEIKKAGGQFVGGLEMGAVPITGAVLVRSDDEDAGVHGFFVRKQQKQHGARKLVEGLPEGRTLGGSKVVIFDDVTTSGDSAMKAVKACQDDGATVVKVVSIVDREEGAAELFAREGIEFVSLFGASEFLALQ